MSAAATLEKPRIVINDRSVELLPAQAKFMDLVDCHYPGFIGGLGSGKSFTLLMRMLRNASMNPGLYGAFVSLTYPLLRDAIIPLMREVLHMHGLLEGVDWTFTKYEMTLRLYCFSDNHGEPATVLFREIQHPERVISVTLAWCLLDEADLMPEHAHQRYDERTRHKKSRTLELAVATSPEGLGFLYENYVVATQDRANHALPEDIDESGRFESEQWRFVRASTRDNKHLADSYVETLLKRYPTHLVNAYIEGLWVPMFVGRCFKFEESVHVTKLAEYNPEAPISISCDFNVDPMSWTLGHWYPAESTYDVFDEIVLPNSNTDETCVEFLDRYWNTDHPHGAGVTIYGDSTGSARSTKAHGTDYDIIDDYLREMPGYQYMVPKSNPSHRNSVNEVNALLKNGLGHIGLRFHPRCKETRKSMLSTRWDEKSRSSKIEKTEGVEHLSDTIRYVSHQIAPIYRTMAHGRGVRRRAAA